MNSTTASITAEYIQYEDDVTNALARLLDIPRGDAQGIIEAHQFTFDHCWHQALVPVSAAKAIDDDSRC